MNKFFLTLVALTMSLVAMATDYTDIMAIDLGAGDPVVQEATVSVTQQEDGSYTFELDNFIYDNSGTTMGIGNIVLSGVTATEADGTISLETSQTVSIAAGDDPSVTFWMGPFLGEIPIDLNAKISNDELYAVIGITASGLGLNLTVTFGTNYKEYSGNMSITLGDSESEQTATLYVGEQADGAYRFLLKNFVYTISGITTGIGNIKLSDVVATTGDDGTISLHAEQTIKITSGDDPSVSFWMGPLLGDVAVEMDGEINEDKLSAEIHIPFSGQDIVVKFEGQTTGDATGIEAIKTNATGKETIYDASGKVLNSPTKGLNIIRKADGTTIKVLNK